MSKGMKKRIALLMAAAMTVSGLASCGGSTEEDSSQKSEESTVNEESSTGEGEKQEKALPSGC